MHEAYTMLPEVVMQHVHAARTELERHKASLEEQRAQIDADIALAARELEKMKALQSNGNINDHAMTQPFAGLSIRLAILKLFATQNPGMLQRKEIAERLLRGGSRSKGADFTSNVSAVLSQMSASDKGEMEVTPKGWAITAKGAQTWKGFQEKRDASD